MTQRNFQTIGDVIEGHSIRPIIKKQKNTYEINGYPQALVILPI